MAAMSYHAPHIKHLGTRTLIKQNFKRTLSVRQCRTAVSTMYKPVGPIALPAATPHSRRRELYASVTTFERSKDD